MQQTRPVKVLLTGGGTGGHITPLLAVAHKLKVSHKNVDITYVGERGSKYASMTADVEVFDEQRRIFAGKLRRYNGESWLKRLTDIPTILLNIRDMFYLFFGFFESLLLLARVKPDVILLKGGFVGVPIGLVAALFRIPFVTHDSDALPGLANRLVARWATYHATGMPASFYGYPKEQTKYVGVLVGDDYELVHEKLQAKYRAELKVPEKGPVLFITGGSNGAKVINKAMAAIIEDLQAEFPDLYVLHQTGRGKEAVYEGVDYHAQNVETHGLVEGMHRYSGAADVIVTRAGANTMAEFGVQGKATIVIPNPLLTGGHQMVNAKEFARHKAVVVVEETELPEALLENVKRLLHDQKLRANLGKKLHSMTKADAAEELALLVWQVGDKRQHG